MKIKLLSLILIVCLSFGCSSVLNVFSSNGISFSYSQVSGDQLKIAELGQGSKSEKRMIYDSKSEQEVGFIEVKNKIERFESQKYWLNITNLSKNENEYSLNMELEIANNFLEKNDQEQDKIIVWSGNNLTTLFSGVSKTRNDIKEKPNDNSTIFTFYVILNQSLKNNEISIQSLNVIQ